MKDATIGFLAGVIIAIGLTASSASSMRDEALADAAASGYLVHEQKAYRVTRVEGEAANDGCSPPTPTADGGFFPGDCPSPYVEVGDMLVPKGHPCLDNGEWGKECLAQEEWR